MAETQTGKEGADFKADPALRAAELGKYAKIIDKSEIPAVRDALDSSVIGQGTEKIVLEHPHRDGEVIGIYGVQPTNPEANSREIKKQYYLNKIVGLLYPNQIPEAHAAYSEPASIVADKITAKETKPAKGLFGKFKASQEKKKAEKRIWEATYYLPKELYEKFGIHIDEWPTNFIIDEKDDIYYVDGLKNAGIKPDALELAIRETLTGEDQIKALKYLDRLRPLL